MAYFSVHDLAIISAHRKPASRFGFAVLHRGKDHWRHSGETGQRHHQMDRISEQAAQAATQGRLTRNMGRSLGVSFIPIFRINTAHFTPA